MILNINQTLDDPGVLAAKKNFEEKRQNNSRCKLKANFQELFEEFARCSSFRAIAKTYRVSVECVRLLHKQYFRDLPFCGSNGRRREKKCTLKRYRSLADQLPTDSFSTQIAKLALSKGLSVRKISYKDNKLRFQRHGLLINQKKCWIRQINSIFRPGRKQRTKYSSVSVRRARLENCDFIIVYQRAVDYPRRIFVIPSQVILEAYGYQKSRQFKRQVYFYLPLQKISLYRKHFSKIDFWTYENAWHLLGETM